MKLNMLLFIVFCFTGFGCHNNQYKESKVMNIRNDTDIIRDIPEWYRISSFTQKRDEKLNTLLNLGSLQNGFDSLQIRIWIDCGNKFCSLIVLERKALKWNATFYSFQISYKENSDFEIQNLKIESKLPKSGWHNFSENLMKTRIIDLPDHMKFYPKYNLPNDADRVLVEIGLLKKYRLYEYPELGLNSNIESGPGKLNQALKLIETEFNYTRPCQNSDNIN